MRRPGPPAQHLAADRLEEVRLPEPHGAVEEQRVVLGPGVVGDGPRDGVRQLVARPDDELVERVVRLEDDRRQVGAAQGRTVRLRGPGGGPRTTGRVGDHGHRRRREQRLRGPRAHGVRRALRWRAGPTVTPTPGRARAVRPAGGVRDGDRGCRVGRRLAVHLEPDRQGPAEDVADRRLDGGAVLARHPLGEELVRHPEHDGVRLARQQRRAREPGLELPLAEPGADRVQDPVQVVAVGVGGARHPGQRFRGRGGRWVGSKAAVRRR